LTKKIRRALISSKSTAKTYALSQTSMVLDGILSMTKGNEMSDLPILFTANQVAKIMGISRSQVYVLMNKGHLGSVHIGRSRRITRGQVDSFITDLSSDA